MSPPTDQVKPHCCDIASGSFRISLVPLLLSRAVEYSTRQYKAHPLHAWRRHVFPIAHLCKLQGEGRWGQRTGRMLRLSTLGVTGEAIRATANESKAGYKARFRIYVL